VPEVFGAGRRDGDLARRAIEEPEAKTPLEALHVGRDHRARKPELVSSARERAELRDPAESTHGVDIVQALLVIYIEQ
jgi:hypothetical protein